MECAPAGGAAAWGRCPGPAPEALRAALPLVERLALAAPAAMWISSRISASLCGQAMRFCRSGNTQLSDPTATLLIEQTHLKNDLHVSGMQMLGRRCTRACMAA
jgi:hypothetical protein